MKTTTRKINEYPAVETPPPCPETCWQWADRDRSAWRYRESVHHCSHVLDGVSWAA